MALQSTKYCILILLAALISACGQEKIKPSTLWHSFEFATATTEDTEHVLFMSVLSSPLSELKETKITKLDFDKDSKPEYILHIQNKARCGSSGCAYTFMDRQNNKWVLNQGIIAHDIQYQQNYQNSGQMALLVNNQNIWTWTGYKFEFSHQIPLPEEK